MEECEVMGCQWVFVPDENLRVTADVADEKSCVKTSHLTPTILSSPARRQVRYTSFVLHNGAIRVVCEEEQLLLLQSM